MTGYSDKKLPSDFSIGQEVRFWDKESMRSYRAVVRGMTAKKVRVDLSWEKNKLVSPAKLRS